MITDETDGTAEFCVVRKQGDYVLIAVTPKGRERESYYVSVGGAEVLVSELQGAMSSAQPSVDVEARIKEIGERLVEQRDEPWPNGSESDRLHYWRDKAIQASRDLAALRQPTQEKVDRQDQPT